MTDKIPFFFIVAGNNDQAQQLIRSHALTHHECMYVQDVRSIVIRALGTPHIKIGEWYEHPDIDRIDEALKLRNSEELPDWKFGEMMEERAKYFKVADE